MSKELEALQVIIKNKGLNGIKEPVEIIETALIDYKKLNKDYSIVVNEKNELCVMFVKEHRALEIIKEKNVDILRIKITQNVEQYNARKIKGCRNLTQEEYELLKKVLL